MYIQTINLQNNNTSTQNHTFSGSLTPKIISKGYDKVTDGIAKGIGKIIDTQSMQKFANKYGKSNLSNFMFSGTSILVSSFMISEIARSKTIEKDRKKPLMLNTGISCAIATVGGFTVDKLLDKGVDKFTESFKAANTTNKNLSKYLDGIKVAKSALIFGTIYRFVVPVLSMFLAEKFVEKDEKKLNKTA